MAGAGAAEASVSSQRGRRLRRASLRSPPSRQLCAGEVDRRSGGQRVQRVEEDDADAGTKQLLRCSYGS